MSKRQRNREAERIARQNAAAQNQQKDPQSKTVVAEAAAAPAAQPANDQLARAQAFFAADQPQVATPESAAQPLSAAQLAANRANAQLSTGAKSPEGQARSSMNALKHGLTAKTVLLPNEDPAKYQRELDAILHHFQPANHEELRLAQSILDINWRLDRIQRFETAILFKGQRDAAAQYEDCSPLEREQLIEADAYLKYERQLRNLHIQEARLRRTLEKDRAELKLLQKTRRHEEELQQAQAPQPQPPQEPNGFVFSTDPEPEPTPTEAQATHPEEQAQKAA